VGQVIPDVQDCVVPMTPMLAPIPCTPVPDGFATDAPFSPYVKPVVPVANAKTPSKVPLANTPVPFEPVPKPVTPVLPLLPVIAGKVVLLVTTVNLPAGLVVPMTTFPPAEKIGELPNVVVPVHIGIAWFVPDPVTWAEAIDTQNTTAKTNQAFLSFILNLLGLLLFSSSPLGTASPVQRWKSDRGLWGCQDARTCTRAKSARILALLRPVFCHPNRKCPYFSLSFLHGANRHHVFQRSAMQLNCH
jgi:hypothetical protein